MKAIGLLILIIISYNIITNYTLDNTRGKANKLIENIELYKVQNGSYPKQLNDLIPDYYSKIPRNYSSILSKFMYSYDETNKKYHFFYTYLAPYGRYSYLYDEKKWINID